MVAEMKRLIVLFTFLLNVHIAGAQFGISGGLSTLKGFGTPKPYVGMHIGAEIPRDDQISFYGRASFYLKQMQQFDPGQNQLLVQSYDPTSPVQFQFITYDQSFNYTVLEGGNRYYIGEGYDSGFGAYGGGNASIIFNSVKRKYDWGTVSEADYYLPSSELPKGSVFNLGFGLEGGVKYTFSGLGTLYFDTGFSYLVIGYPSNATASSASVSMWTPLMFSFNFGFRKDLY
jgi:hypothetical protein